MSKLLLWSCVQFERHIKWTWAFNLKYSPFLCVTVHCRLLYSTVYTSAIYCTVSLFNSHTFSLWQNALPLTSGRLQTTGTSSSCDRLVLSRSKGLRVWSFSGHINKKKQDKRHWTDRKPQSNQIPCSVLQYLIVWWRFLDSRHFLQAFFTTKTNRNTVNRTIQLETNTFPAVWINLKLLAKWRCHTWLFMFWGNWASTLLEG